MSSPVQGPVQGSTEDSFPEQAHGHADEQSVSESQHEAETRRLQREVVEAARRLEREAVERAPLTGFQLQDNTISFRIPVVRRAVERPSQEETNERVWSALRTEFLPPSQQGWGIPGVAVIVGSIGAVTIAAAVALLVVNLIQVPGPSVSASGEDEVAKNESFSATAVTLSKIAAAQAKMQSADDEPPPAALAAVPPAQTAPPAPTGPMLATAGPANDMAAARPAAPLPSPSSEIEPSPSPEIKPAAIESPAPPAAASAPPAAALAPPAAAPEPQPMVTLSQDEIASLLKRGRELIAAGDIASARLVLTHLADAGVAEASFVLAGTFDPTVLESLRIVGMRPDPAKARVWYSRAAEQGSVEARQRLQALR
jgi:hypothetical protein